MITNKDRDNGFKKIQEHINQILQLTSNGVVQVKIDTVSDDERIVYLDKYRKPICSVSIKGKSPLGVVKETFGEL